MKFKRLLFVVTSLLIMGLSVFFLIPKGQDLSQNVVHVGVNKARSAAIIRPAATDKEFPLDAQNTTISFTAAKSIAGKIINVSGGWSGKFGSRLKGTAIVDPKARVLRQVRVEIDIPSLWSEHEVLTKNLKACGFFNIKEHPSATFISTSVKAAPSDAGNGGRAGAAPPSQSYLMEGNFQLNGIEKSIQIPVQLTEGAAGAKIECRFAIDRRDFEVIFRDNSAFPLLNDSNILPNVALKIVIECQGLPQGDAVGNTAKTRAVTASTQEPAQPAKNFTQVIPFSQVAFDMVVIPGDESKGIKPFYMGKTEVTWDEFLPWALCKDIADESTQAEQRKLEQRPSAPYIALDRGFGMDRRPALSMSRLSAELYCAWLSKQTGRKYRLPTEKEWVYVYELGGNSLKEPLSAEEANRIAVWEANSFSQSASRNTTLPVGSKEPNKLGIYDMAGNAAEWVTDTGKDRVIRGGHFLAKLDQLGGPGREVQDDEVWNMNYPGDPRSIWWFVDAMWVGFRVVCEQPETQTPQASREP